MEIYYFIVLFIFGTVFGSFFGVVGSRLPKGESIVKPKSHCSNCGHELGASELVPILSYLIQRGKCKVCQVKIGCIHPIFELITGLLFGITYLVFGFSIDFLLAVTFISMLLIIIVSDYQTMIIPDEVLIVFELLLIIEIFIKSGLTTTITMIFHGILAFIIMLLIKKMGDFLFKKESMGGGDIKLMFIYGLYFKVPTTLVSIFLASVIGLPIALILLKKNNSHEIPFGPFLAIAAIILTLTPLDFNYIYDILIKF